MVSDFHSDRGFERTNAVSSEAFGGNGLEELGIFVTKLNPSDCTPLFPVVFLMLQKPEQVIFENASKVSFWCGQSSTILNIVKLQKSFVGVFNGYFKARDFLAPLFESMTNCLELLPDSCRAVMVLIESDRFVPGMFNNLHKPRMSKLICLEPEEFAFWD